MTNKILVFLLLMLNISFSCKEQPTNQELRVPSSKFSGLNPTPKRAHLVVVFRDEHGNPFLNGKITLTTPADYQFTIFAGNASYISARLPYDRYTISMEEDLFSLYDYEIEGLKDPEKNKLSFVAVGDIRLIITFTKKPTKPLPTI